MFPYLSQEGWELSELSEMVLDIRQSIRRENWALQP